MKFSKLIITFLIIIILIFIIFYLFSFAYNPDNDFVELIKNMAEKNHNNPQLFIEKYKNTTTEEEKLKIILTNNFYECIYNNSFQIKTKSDVNIYCGHFIKFK